MKFSVVGLPHYTIWHLYEPSVDDIKHMEEMEREQKEKEKKENEEKERMERIKAQFESPAEQWAKDKSNIKDMAQKAAEAEREKEKEKKEKEKSKEKGKGKVERADSAGKPTKEAAKAPAAEIPSKGGKKE